MNNVISTKFCLYLTLGTMTLGTACTDTLRQKEQAQQALDAEALIAKCAQQERETPQAPQDYYLKPNPLAPTSDNIEQGKRLYERDAQPVSCASCHGVDGDGQGPIGKHLQPPATDFTCKEIMDALPDGQFFWVIENGSGLFDSPVEYSPNPIKRPGRRPRSTAMRSHKHHLTEQQIWQLVLYLRTFSK